MLWIESIAHEEGRLAPVYVDEAGSRTVGSLRYGRANFPRRGYIAAAATDLSLESMCVADTAAYLAALGIKNVDPAGHRVYALQGPNKRILVPAVVMLSALLGRLSLVGDRLLEPASLDRLATPVFNANGPAAVGFCFRSGLSAKDASSQSVQSRFLWLTCFPSARMFWGSVYRSAVQGQLAFTSPKATIDATFAGHRDEHTVYATRMTVSRLMPTEQPYPFAENRVQGEFEFYEHRSTQSDKLNKFRASGGTRCLVKVQADLLRGPAGWATSEAEWSSALAKLKELNFHSPRSVKGNIDLVLEKFGGGHRWTSMGPGWRSAQTIYQHWGRRGQWDAFKAVLNDMRRDDMRRDDKC